MTLGSSFLIRYIQYQSKFLSIHLELVGVSKPLTGIELVLNIILIQLIQSTMLNILCK